MIFLLLLLLAVMANVQENNFKDVNSLWSTFHGIWQKEGTNELLKEYLMPYANEDQVIAILFSPKECPRCEAQINIAFDYLRKIRLGKEPVLIAAYPDVEVAKEYLERFNAREIIIDSLNLHGGIFHYNDGWLNTGYFLQIDMQQGRLMAGGDIVEISEENLRLFCNNTDYLPYYEKDDEEGDVASVLQNMQGRMPEGTYPTVRIQEGQGKHVARTGRFYSPAWKEDCFLYRDDLSSVGQLYETAGDTARFVQEMVPDSAQERAFVDLPEGDYEQYKAKGMTFVIALATGFAPDGTPLVTYSIPEMFEEKENRVAYYNKPVMIALEEPGDSCRMVAFDFEFENWPYYMYTHDLPFCLTNENLVAFGCKRRYPKKDLDELFNDIRAGKCADIDNLYSDAYYEQSPFAALFDLETGKKVRMIGQLDSIYRTTSMAYFIATFTGGTHGRRFVYTDGFSGKIYISNTDTYETEKEIVLFRVEVKDLEDKLARRYEDDYFNQFLADFNRQVTEVQPDSGGIHCLLRIGASAIREDDDLYEYLYVDYDGNVLKRIPIVYEEGDDVLAVSLHREKDGTAAPYYFCKNSKGVFLKTIETD